MKSFITHINYHLPEYVLTNEELKLSFPDLNIDELTRHIGERFEPDGFNVQQELNYIFLNIRDRREFVLNA